MTAGPLPASYDEVDLSYGSISVNDDLNVTLLDIAEREQLLEHRGTTADNHYAILCNGRRLLITSGEVPGFVLALFVTAGKDTEPIRYRTGLDDTRA